MITITKNNLMLCKRWLLLAVWALAGTGVLSIAIILLRLPFVTAFFPNAQEFFDTSLIVHVNLSVLVWMCSIISIILSLAVTAKSKYFYFLWCSSAIASFFIFISMFVPDTLAIKNNYIPVLENKLFLYSLSILLVGILLNAILSIKSSSSIPLISIGTIGLVIIILSAFLCFIMAWRTMPSDLNKIQFYEYLFWGGGHLLQFAFTQAMFLIYLIIPNTSTTTVNPKIIILALLANTFTALFAPIIYLFYSADDLKLIDFFTWHMRIAGAILPLFLIIVVFCNIKNLLKDNYCLLCSFILFIYGGILGVLTTHGNVTIPAHYHGSIVGISLAFMSFIYWLLPQLGYREVKNTMIKLQIYTYSIGQFLHITGLEWLGGYGAIRKVASLPSASAGLARLCFVLGGLTATIGGLLFVVIMFIHIYRSNRTLTL